MKKRLIYFSLAVFCFMACVIIVKLFNDNSFIRGSVGDILIVSLIYFFIKIFNDFNPLKLSIFTLLVAFITESLQYIELIPLLGLEHNTITRLILGSVFDPYDLIAYTVGAVLIYIIDSRVVMKLNIEKGRRIKNETNF